MLLLMRQSFQVVWYVPRLRILFIGSGGIQFGLIAYQHCVDLSGDFLTCDVITE